MRRPTSLFWTLASAFLVVLVLGVILQVVLLALVVAPLLSAQRRSGVEAQAQACAAAVGELLQGDEGAQAVPRLLRTFQGGRRDPLFLYVSQDGEWSSPVRGGDIPWSFRRAAESQAPDLVLPEPNPSERRGSESRRFAPDGPEDRGTQAGPGAGPDGRGGRPGPGPDGRGGPGRFDWRDPLPPDSNAPFTGARSRLVSAPVTTGSGAAGTVWVSYAERRPTFPRELPRPGVVFLPAAVLLSALAGLWVFRGLARRLRVLESHAARVASGDLSARVPDLGRDEIGALGRSLDEMTARLAESREKLEEAERQRRRFLADVTHELSTPLTSIRGFAQTLIDPAVPISDDERSRYTGHVLEEAERMDRLVSELLDLARLEGGGDDFHPVDLDLADLVRRQLDRRRVTLEKDGTTLVSEIPGGPLPARLDGGRVEQVLDNLLANAHRFSGAEAWIRVALQPIGEARARLVVEDDGPGFSDAELPFVFDRFYRGEPSRPSGSTGLGLAIVKEIVRRHDGAIFAENRPEGGARLIVELPLASFVE